LTRALGKLGDLSGWNVREFNTGDERDGKPVGVLAREACQLGKKLSQVGTIGVVGDGQRTVTKYFHSTQHLAGKQNTIAEK